MNEEMVNDLIGQLNLSLTLAGKAADLIHIPVEDARELVTCLELLKTYISKG